MQDRETNVGGTAAGGISSDVDPDFTKLVNRCADAKSPEELAAIKREALQYKGEPWFANLSQVITAREHGLVAKYGGRAESRAEPGRM